MKVLPRPVVGKLGWRLGLLGLLVLALLSILLLLAVGQGWLNAGVLSWYNTLNTVNVALAGPIGRFTVGLGIPGLAALLFGLLGATSPCQLSTNSAALAYIVNFAPNGARMGRATAGYVMGKMALYTLLGGAILVAGASLVGETIPVITLVRRALGPLMILAGLVLLGVVRPNIALGQNFSVWLEERRPQGALAGGFVLGVAFALAFCPTLLLLFFGLTLPLAFASELGFAFPAIFALGTTIPLAVLVGLLILGGIAGPPALRQVGRIDRIIRPVAGVIFLLAGLNDTILYWIV